VSVEYKAVKELTRIYYMLTDCRRCTLFCLSVNVLHMYEVEWRLLRSHRSFAKKYCYLFVHCDSKNSVRIIVTITVSNISQF